MRDPDWLIENGFEIQADVEERDADLRDAEFLAPKRRVPASHWPGRIIELDDAGADTAGRAHLFRPSICARCGSPRCQGGTDCDPERYT